MLAVVRASDDIRPLRGGTVRSRGVHWPVWMHLIEHGDGLVLVDTGMIDTHPSLAGWDPRPEPVPGDLVPRVVAVVNTHLHFDHCGGNRLFPGVPIHVQRLELADARSGAIETVPEWVDFEGATYVEHHGEGEVLPGIRVVPAPGHTAGHQVVVVETGEEPVVLGGDVAYSFRELGHGDTEGRRVVLALGGLTYLAHAEHPRVPEFHPEG
jgi:N-acyl homoserine lactone hydrolase